MTETGYRSHFHQSGMIENEYNGNVVAAVTDWLNTEAESQTWIDYVERSRQGYLF